MHAPQPARAPTPRHPGRSPTRRLPAGTPTWKKIWKSVRGSLGSSPSPSHSGLTSTPPDLMGTRLAHSMSASLIWGGSTRPSFCTLPSLSSSTAGGRGGEAAGAAWAEAGGGSGAGRQAAGAYAGGRGGESTAPTVRPGDLVAVEGGDLGHLELGGVLHPGDCRGPRAGWGHGLHFLPALPPATAAGSGAADRHSLEPRHAPSSKQAAAARPGELPA